MIYNGGKYFYRTNIQGDVIGLVDTHGASVVDYVYDAWGKPLSTTGTLAITVGKNNPLRYRGYVYDNETGWYYLQSRYYDPEIGRFINADVPESILLSDNILGTNLFAYCMNNPINLSDPDGHTPIQAVFAAIGAIAGLYLGDYVARKLGYAPKDKGWKNAAKYWTIRAGMVAGTAVVGWFAAGTLTAILKGFIFSSPKLIAITPLWVYKFLGIGIGSGTVVLGKYPLYVNLALRLGSCFYGIATKAWNAMTKAQQWAANRDFLDKVINSGQKIILQTNAKNASGDFLKEINYLLSRGYKIVENGWAMVKK